MATIADLMTAFQDAVNAQHKFNEAYEENDGYSWDWDGYWHDMLTNAQQGFEAALEQYIDERIAAALAKRDD